MKHSVNVRRHDIMQRVRDEMSRFDSPIVIALRANNNELILPGLHIHLASSFGFCDGVRHALEVSLAALYAFPQKRVYLIGKIIHNSVVNKYLEEKGVLPIPNDSKSELYEQLTPEDVVIIPAFGISTELRQRLEERNVLLVDSTCGNVIKVWHKVRAYAAEGVTSIIHGKPQHEESIATMSHARGKNGTGHYLVLRGEQEASRVADYICNGGDRSRFLNDMSGCYSPGFDPDTHLLCIGMANQTTMLKKESLRIQDILRQAIIARDGTDKRFHGFNTICNATQDRQEALLKILNTQNISAMIVIGGYDSSNTTHLAMLSSSRLPTYYIKDASCIHTLGHVTSYQPECRKEITTSLPPEAHAPHGVWHVGITAGASCPASCIEEVIRRLVELRSEALNV